MTHNCQQHSFMVRIARTQHSIVENAATTGKGRFVVFLRLQFGNTQFVLALIAPNDIPKKNSHGHH